MALSPEIAEVLERHLVPGDDARTALVAVPGAAAGVPPDVLAALVQAYIRGLGRIVAAESDAIRKLLKSQPSGERAAALDRLLSTTLPEAHQLFEVLHGALLRDGLADSLTDDSLGEPEAPERVVALVDLCDSTRYLGAADGGATQSMVDALFDAGQAAAAEDGVWAVKYVGDGVFLVGRSAATVAQASARAVTVLERSTPMRARAGIACGPVVRRAGDYFGPPVNLAHRLTTVAEPGVLLVAESPASRLDGALRVSERREVEVRGFDDPVTVAVVPVT